MLLPLFIKRSKFNL